MNTETAFAFTQAFRDFRGASWGMSKEEVKLSEGLAPLNEGEGFISYRERVMGLDAVVAFHFLDGSLVEAGIVDPTKVVRVALENAVSAASLLLLTEATMTEIPEPKDERAPAPPYE